MEDVAQEHPRVTAHDACGLPWQLSARVPAQRCAQLHPSLDTQLVRSKMEKHEPEDVMPPHVPWSLQPGVDAHVVSVMSTHAVGVPVHVALWLALSPFPQPEAMTQPTAIANQRPGILEPPDTESIKPEGRARGKTRSRPWADVTKPAERRQR